MKKITLTGKNVTNPEVVITPSSEDDASLFESDPRFEDGELAVKFTDGEGTETPWYINPESDVPIPALLTVSYGIPCMASEIHPFILEMNGNPYYLFGKYLEYIQFTEVDELATPVPEQRCQFIQWLENNPY